MNKAVTLLLASCLTLGGFAQTDVARPVSAPEEDSHVLGQAIARFYRGLSLSNDSARKAVLTSLFLKEAQINAIPATGVILSGDLSAFMRGSSEFFTTYDVRYEETDRELEYYADLAVMHSVCTQRVRLRSSGQEFESRLWFTVDLIYTPEGWRIAYASWTAELSPEELDELPDGDVLWRKN